MIMGILSLNDATLTFLIFGGFVVLSYLVLLIVKYIGKLISYKVRKARWYRKFYSWLKVMIG